MYVLDISEMAQVLGFPACDNERFVTDPEFGTLLPNASYLVPKTNLTPPMEQYTNMYPFKSLPHYESLNSGITARKTPPSVICAACSLSFLVYSVNSPAMHPRKGSIILSASKG